MMLLPAAQRARRKHLAKQQDIEIEPSPAQIEAARVAAENLLETNVELLQAIIDDLDGMGMQAFIALSKAWGLDRTVDVVSTRGLSGPLLEGLEDHEKIQRVYAMIPASWLQPVLGHDGRVIIESVQSHKPMYLIRAVCVLLAGDADIARCLHRSPAGSGRPARGGPCIHTLMRTTSGYRITPSASKGTIGYRKCRQGAHAFLLPFTCALVGNA